jgi:hypothetical protein
MKKVLLTTLLLILVTGNISSWALEYEPAIKPSFYMVNNGMRQMNWGYDTSPFAQGQTTAADGRGFFNSQVDGFDYPWFFETRMRPGLVYTGGPKLNGMLEMELNSAWGRESSVGSIEFGHGYRGKLRFRQYWVETRLGDGQGSLDLKLGRQNFSTMHGVIVGLPMMEGIKVSGLVPASWGILTLGSAIVDTRGDLEVKNTWHQIRFDPTFMGRFDSALYAGYLHINDDADPDQNRYKDPLSYTKAPQLTNGSWIMGRDADDRPTGGVADVFWLGLQSNGVIGPVFVSGHAVLNFASFAQSDSSLSHLSSGSGLFLDFSATYDTGLFGIGPEFIFTSGHDGNRESDSYGGFLGLAPDVGFTRMFFDGAPIFNVFGHDDASVTGSGLVALKLNTFYRIGADTRLNAAVAFLNAHKNRPQMPDTERGLVYHPVAEGSGKYYGTELNLWFDWEPINGVIFTTELDAILPGNYFKGNDRNGFGRELDPAYRILLSSQVSF